MKKILILMILIVHFPVYSAGNLHISKIDWQKGELISWGESKAIYNLSGKPVDITTNKPISINNARIGLYRRSKNKAIKNAISLIKTININTDKTVYDLVKENDRIKLNISKLLDSNIKLMGKPENMLESICCVKIKTGSILKYLNVNFPADKFPEFNSQSITTEYSSLIIDTRGLDIKPMLLPVVFNEKGLEVYSKNYVLPRYALKNNMVTYVHTHEDALKHPKAGENPYYCTALDVLKKSPVISDNDITKFYNYNRNLNNLRKCKVIFIINR